MHPAFSVIFLTTLIGVGQGLFLALFTGQVYALASLLDVRISSDFYVWGSAISLVFLIAGLVASVFHLGRPERAWRAASQWRTSWLSREVILLPIVMGLVSLYGLAHFLGLKQPLFGIGGGALSVDGSLLIGLAATLFTFALFVCTGTIYAGLRVLQEWHAPLTVINFTLLGIASGFILAAGISAWLDNGLFVFYGSWSVVATSLGLLGRSASLLSNRSIKHKSSGRTAIGIRHTTIRQKSMGFMGGSFNTREFFHGTGDKPLIVIRNGFMLLTFFVPLTLLSLALMGTGSPLLPLIAFALQYLGLIAERWYFFAEARHPQNIYYQSMA